MSGEHRLRPGSGVCRPAHRPRSRGTPATADVISLHVPGHRPTELRSELAYFGPRRGQHPSTRQAIGTRHPSGGTEDVVLPDPWKGSPWLRATRGRGGVPPTGGMRTSAGVVNLCRGRLASAAGSAPRSRSVTRADYWGAAGARRADAGVAAGVIRRSSIRDTCLFGR